MGQVSLGTPGGIQMEGYEAKKGDIKTRGVSQKKGGEGLVYEIGERESEQCFIWCRT